MKTRTKLSMILIVVMILNVGIVTIRSEPQKAHALPNKIKVGGVFPIVQRPDAGPDRRDGFLIAISEINNQTGSDRILPDGVELVPNVQDDDNSAAGGTAAANALVTWGADIVIGSSGSSVSAAMATVLTPLKIVQISYASSSPSLSDRTLYPYFMRVAASDADQGKALANLVGKFGWKKGATICTSDSYGTGLINTFKTAFEAKSGNTIATGQQFDPGATDVSPQVQALIDADPDFVLGNFIDEDAKTALKKAFDLDFYDVPWIATDGWSTTATITDTSVKAAMNMSIGTNPAITESPGAIAFNDTWFDPDWDWLAGPKASQDTGIAFNSYAPFAYDAVYVAAKGLAAAGTTDGDDLLDALYDVTHEGASADIKFNALGEVIGRYDYVQLINNKFSTFGVYAIPLGETVAGPILDPDYGRLHLQDGTNWTICQFEVAQGSYSCPEYVPQTSEEDDDDVPGFGVLVLIVAMSSIVAIMRKLRRKR